MRKGMNWTNFDKEISYVDERSIFDKENLYSETSVYDVLKGSHSQ